MHAEPRSRGRPSAERAYDGRRVTDHSRATHRATDCPSAPTQEGAARGPPRLLRRRRPRRRHGGEGARALRRRRSTCARRSCTTSTSWRPSSSAGAIFVEETDEVPEGCARGVQRARRRAVGPRGGREPQPAHDRRHLPARDQGAPGGAPLRRRGLPHPAHRPRGPRGGRGHDGRGARGDHARRRPVARRRRSRSAPDEKVVWLSQTTLSVDETIETVDRLRLRLPLLDEPAQRRHLLRHAEPPARGEGHRAAAATCSSSSAAATRRTRCGWSRSGSTPARARRTASTRPRELDEAWFDGAATVGLTSGASVPGDPRARRAGLAGRARVGRRRGGARRRRSTCIFALPPGAAPRPQGRRRRR